MAKTEWKSGIHFCFQFLLKNRTSWLASVSLRKAVLCKYNDQFGHKSNPFDLVLVFINDFYDSEVNPHLEVFMQRWSPAWVEAYCYSSYIRSYLNSELIKNSSSPFSNWNVYTWRPKYLLCFWINFSVIILILFSYVSILTSWC